ncbi:MAG TPA: Lrp/AsnC family transcriptional regulator [Methanocorpusculum sp.]|nr:Lrp/AsnC family transcriptional regulator [Methanocorpusculum sp.]HJJ33144.1 Lrp/AsnC family transcriptional regulator [Methanocorpusculum sp.]HJJ44483.1 Lrp/AsnC family transcriptional regulator [Methanocorpusculum sp.]HJJ58020.1 Lrp/AsnC family transcriptional regulator [Methanocorpusculum sp.]HJJ59555.1 Lrp/AsnC family transcriptional regulator [Methanocorpusculum sp.]
MVLSREEIEERTEAAYDFICRQPDGILQSELWKALDMDSRTCSRVIKELEDAKRVTREKVGGVSYLIRGVIVPKTIDPMLLMAGESIVPCVACTEECNVSSCKLLEDWIYDLVFSDMK